MRQARRPRRTPSRNFPTPFAKCESFSPPAAFILRVLTINFKCPAVRSESHISHAGRRRQAAHEMVAAFLTRARDADIKLSRGDNNGVAATCVSARSLCIGWLGALCLRRVDVETTNILLSPLRARAKAPFPDTRRVETLHTSVVALFRNLYLCFREIQLCRVILCERLC